MLEVNPAKQFRELRCENERLKRILADEMLGMELLKEALENSDRTGPQASSHPGVCGYMALCGSRGMPPLRASSKHVSLCGQR